MAKKKAISKKAARYLLEVMRRMEREELAKYKAEAAATPEDRRPPTWETNLRSKAAGWCRLQGYLSVDAGVELEDLDQERWLGDRPLGEERRARERAEGSAA